MPSTENLYDVIIIGGGPAGLTAALYLARARYRVLVLEKEHFGGQITITSEIVNFPGVARTSGTALTDTIRHQGESFGAEFLLAEAKSLSLTGDVKTVTTSRGEFQCFGVLLATGAHPRMIGFTGEAEFKGHGVAYCATCDGEFFTGKDVFVIGGGFAAAEESVFLTKYARHVTILIHGNDFTCAKATADATKKNKNITILTNTEVEEVSGDSTLNYMRYKNNITGEVTEYHSAENDTFGVFVFAGYSPETELVKDAVTLDEKGYIVTDKSQKTNIDGVYAAGDVCIKSLRQVVTAVGDGALAATELERVAAALQQKTGLHPVVSVKEKAGAESGGQADTGTDSSSLFDEAMLQQLKNVFSRMENPLCLRLFPNDSEVSKELEAYMKELTSLSDKLTLQTASSGSDTRASSELPCVEIRRADGTYTGLAFHGAPGGHEFTSFVLGLYNASGSGQTIEPSLLEHIRQLHHPFHLQILVSLSCTMCPELVTAAQKIASVNPEITAEVYDLNHFPDLRDRYKVMSVPCLVVNEEHVSFGKKDIGQICEILSGI